MVHHAEACRVVTRTEKVTSRAVTFQEVLQVHSDMADLLIAVTVVHRRVAKVHKAATAAHHKATTVALLRAVMVPDQAQVTADLLHMVAQAATGDLMIAARVTAAEAVRLRAVATVLQAEVQAVAMALLLRAVTVLLRVAMARAIIVKAVMAREDVAATKAVMVLWTAARRIIATTRAPRHAKTTAVV